MKQKCISCQKLSVPSCRLTSQQTHLAVIELKTQNNSVITSSFPTQKAQRYFFNQSEWKCLSAGVLEFNLTIAFVMLTHEEWVKPINLHVRRTGSMS